MTSAGYRACDRAHAAPPCVDPACYCEAHARRADKILPGLGDLIRRGVLEPSLEIAIGDQVVPALRAIRTADPADPKTPFRLSNEELMSWADRVGVYRAPMEETYIRLVVDEIRERRAAEAAFAEIDRRFQDLDCGACDAGPGYCAEHAGLARQWRGAREDLLDEARIHRGYLLDAFKLGKEPT